MHQLVRVPFSSVGDELLVTAEGEWVPVRRICDNLGIQFQRQQQKLQDNPQFTCSLMYTRDTMGREQQMACLPLSELAMWLCAINANRVRSEVRPKLLAYQQECQQVLYQHFMPGGAQDYNQFMSQLGLLRGEMQEGFTEMRGLIAQQQDEIWELRATLQMFISDTDEKEIRALIQQLKQESGADGRTIVGQVRAILGTSGIYTADPRHVKNALRNLLGKGVFGSAN